MLAVLAASGSVAPATKTALIIITIIMVLPVPALPFSVAGISRDRMALVGEWAEHRRYQRDERSRCAAILSLYPRFLLFAFVIAGIGATIIGVAVTSLLRGRTLTTGSVGITSSVTAYRQCRSPGDRLPRHVPGDRCCTALLSAARTLARRGAIATSGRSRCRRKCHE
jgi:hypothetical protein